MGLKKFFCAGLFAAIIFSSPLATFAAESANDKLIKIEQDTYGAEQTGAILNRIGKIEKDYNGKNMQGNMNARIDSIYNILYENIGEPGIIAKVNALEWNFYHEVKSDGISERLSELESEVLGKKSEGSFSSRIRELASSSFGSENIPMTQMQLPANTLVKVELLEPINSKTIRVGDKVSIKVSENVIVENKLIFAKGLRGEGVVKSVRKAQGWTGKNGKIEIDFNTLRAIDGRNIETFVGDEAKKIMIEKEMIQGASLVAMNLNDNWNKVLVHGKNLDVAAGTELYIQTKNNSSVYVLQVDE